MSTQQKIAEIEAKAAESELLGRLSADPEVQTYNRGLAAELRVYAQKLKTSLSEQVAGLTG